MFKKEYQGGTSVDVFSAQGHDPVQHWKLTGSVKKDFDKSVRGYVYVLEGGASTTTTRMTLPKSDKSSLCLLQPCCVLQLLVPDSAKLAVDLSVVDSSGSRRRLHLSTSQREVSATPLNARLPLAGLLTGQWLNLCVDVGSLVQSLFKGSSFKSLEGVALGGSCRLRRLFTLKTTPTTSDIVEIPRAFHMNSVILQTIIISPESLVSTESQTRSREGGGGRGGGRSDVPYSSTSSELRPTHVAFGKKVAIPDHILTSRQSSSDARGRVKAEARLEPSPPSTLVNSSLLKIQKARVCMVSGRTSTLAGGAAAQGKDQVPHVVGSAVSPPLANQPSPPKMRGQQELDSRRQVLTSVEDFRGAFQVNGKGWHGLTKDSEEHVLRRDESHVRSRDEDRVRSKDEDRVLGRDEDHVLSKDTNHVPSRHTDHVPSRDEDHVLSRDEELALTVLQQQVQEVVDEGEHIVSEGEDIVSSSEEEEDPRYDEGNQVYSYRSAPKSAERRVPAQVTHESSSSSSRGAKLEEDFLSPKDSSPKHSSSISHNSQTRLSDDYDWRQYASAEDQGLANDDLSLRTRLAGAQPHPQSHHAHTPTASAGLDDTLSESMTLSGVTEQFKNARHSPFLDSLDTRGMGGMLSPTLLEGEGTHGAEDEVDGGGVRTDELELMYDPQLNCFYDPTTCRYYELVQPN